jgi:hypothetical protein
LHRPVELRSHPSHALRGRTRGTRRLSVFGAGSEAGVDCCGSG